MLSDRWRYDRQICSRLNVGTSQCLVIKIFLWFTYRKKYIHIWTHSTDRIYPKRTLKRSLFVSQPSLFLLTGGITKVGSSRHTHTVLIVCYFRNCFSRLKEIKKFSDYGLTDERTQHRSRGAVKKVLERGTIAPSTKWSWGGKFFFWRDNGMGFAFFGKNIL